MIAFEHNLDIYTGVHFLTQGLANTRMNPWITCQKKSILQLYDGCSHKLPFSPNGKCDCH